MFDVKLTRANKLRKLLFSSHHRRSPSKDNSNCTTSMTSSCLSDDEATVPVESTMNKKRARRAVHFPEDSTVETIVHNTAPGLSDDEKTASFWSLKELTQVKTDIKHDLALLETGCTLGALTPRGLEKWRNPLSFRDGRDKVVKAVLAEQTLQSSEQEIDYELLAQASLDESCCHRQAALARAQADHDIVVNMPDTAESDSDKIFGERANQQYQRCRAVRGHRRRHTANV